MKKSFLIFATNNQHKIEEIQHIIGDTIKIVTLKEAGINIDIPEPHDTLSQNASGKSKTIYQLTGKNCFGEDTGLEVGVLNGKPGVKSARYAGEDKDFQANINKLLAELSDQENRKANFKTVISLIWSGEEYFFEGVAEGTIISEQRGTAGFGYDSVFVPEGSKRTFAEMNIDEKNTFSHRRKATDKLIHFLKKQTHATR